MIICSTVLNAGYFLPIVYRAFFRPEDAHHAEHHGNHGEAPLPIVIAIVITAALTVAMFLFPSLPLGLSKAMVETAP